MKTAVLVLVAAVIAAPLSLAGCGSSSGGSGAGESNIRRELVSHHVIYSEHNGKVGYVKVMDMVEGGGPAYRWKYVYDLDWTELGFIDQFGTAYQNKPYSPFEQDVQPRTLRVVRLPSDSAQRNAMRMLGIDPALDDVTFPAASEADLLGAQAK